MLATRCTSLVLLSAACLLNSVASSAAPVTSGTGPGGIGTVGVANDLVLWLRGDAGIVFAVGTNISAWNDQSGRGNHALQATAVDQPNQSVSTNGVPVVTFPGGAQDRLDIAAFNGLSSVAGASIFAMFDSNDVSESNQVVIGTIGTGGAAFPRVQKFTPDAAHRWLTGAHNEAWRYGAGSTVTQLPQTYLATFDGTEALDANRQTIRIDGVSYTPTAGGGPTSADNSVVSAMRIGSWTDTGFNFNGNVGEIAVYNRTLNAAEQQIGENYISSKFDAAIAVAADHYAGDTVGNGHFDHDVFGIGRIGAASVTSSGHAGLGIEQLAIASGEWVLAGHANGSNDITTSDMPLGLERWERSWYIDTTGVGTADLAFDWNDAGNSATFNPEFYGLYFRPINGGPFSLLSVGAVDIGNERVDFFNVALNPLDGFYTLGVVIPEPSTLALLGLGVIGLAVRARRRRSMA